MAGHTSACESLREDSADIWRSLHEHPFVRELAAGTLPLEKFRFYIEQGLLAPLDGARRRRLSELFATATRLELAFWDMAYGGYQGLQRTRGVA